MNRIVKLAAVAALLSLTLFAVGCGSKTEDAGSAAAPGASAASKTDAAGTTGTDKVDSGAAPSSSPVLPPPANAVKK